MANNNKSPDPIEENLSESDNSDKILDETLDRPVNLIYSFQSKKIMITRVSLSFLWTYNVIEAFCVQKIQISH